MPAVCGPDHTPKGPSAAYERGGRVSLSTLLANIRLHTARLLKCGNTERMGSRDMLKFLPHPASRTGDFHHQQGSRALVRQLGLVEEVCPAPAGMRPTLPSRSTPGAPLFRRAVRGNPPATSSPGFLPSLPAFGHAKAGHACQRGRQRSLSPCPSLTLSFTFSSTRRSRSHPAES